MPTTRTVVTRAVIPVTAAALAVAGIVAVTDTTTAPTAQAGPAPAPSPVLVRAYAAAAAPVVTWNPTKPAEANPPLPAGLLPTLPPDPPPSAKPAPVAATAPAAGAPVAGAPVAGAPAPTAPAAGAPARIDTPANADATLAAASAIKSTETIGGSNNADDRRGEWLASDRTVQPNTTRAAAVLLLKDHGWTLEQWGCLDRMWWHESGWNPSAGDPNGTYGIPQALPGSKLADAGADWQTNPVTQIRWGLGYIQNSYGSPCQAWATWKSRAAQGAGWY